MFGTARNALRFSRLRVYSAVLPIVAAQRPRNVSTASFDPTIRQFLVKLAEHQPCFSMGSSSVSIMHEPKLFYQSLLNMIRTARYRLFLSSLYIGYEDVELIQAIQTSLRENHALHVYLHLDLNRSTRPGPDSTAHILLPLLQEHPDRVHVSLFRSPKLKGLMARLVPPRFNEGWGTWHPKIYGADDTILISGANLNTSYFSNRQDRYLQFTSQPGLANYCFAFLQAASTFSYRLLPSPTSKDDYVLDWPDVGTHPHQIEDKARHALLSLQQAQRVATSASLLDSQEKPSDMPGDAHDVLVFPVIQAGQFNIREEERCLSLLFRGLSAQERFSVSSPGTYDGPVVDLTSGYFSLYKPYQAAVIDSPLAYRILAASPKANGFYRSKGISGRIPEAYTLFERHFMRAVRNAGRESSATMTSDVISGVQLHEWEREGWTYHAKGIWVRPTPSSAPVLTLFGSTNLNSRSANLDTELSFVLATTSPGLQKKLAEEVDGLRAHAHPWQGEGDSEARRVRMGTRPLVALVGGML